MSKRLNKLREKRGAMADELNGVIAKLDAIGDRIEADNERPATEEEATEIKAHKDRIDVLKADLDKLDAEIAEEQKIEVARAAAAVPVVLSNGDRSGVVPAAARMRVGTLKAFKGQNAEENAYVAGKFLQATLFRNTSDASLDAVGAAARQWCEERGFMQRAANEGSNTAGGYLVPNQFENAIIDLREEYGTFRRLVPVLAMSSDTMTLPKRTGGLTASFVDENAAATESDKTWGQVKFVAKKLACLSRMSTEIAEDAIISIADDLANEMAYAFAIKEDDTGWNGTGTSAYGGITGVRTKFAAGVSSLAGAVDAASGHDTFAEIDAADIRKLMAKLPVYARRNAKFYGSQVCWDITFVPLIQAAGGLTGEELGKGFPKRYLGYEFVIDITLPTAQSDISDTAMFFFGDLGLAAKMAQRRGITIRQSDQRYFEYDQVGILANERIDINVHDIGDTSTAGPIVAMMAE